MNRLTRCLMGIAAALAMVQSSPAAEPGPANGHEYVYVQSTLSKDIWVVDAETKKIAGHIPVGDFTDDVIGAPDGKTAFANAQIWGGNPLSWQFNEAGKVFAIDTATDKIKWSVFVDGSPHHLAVSPDGARVYVPLFNRFYILVLDARTGQEIERWHSVLGNHTPTLSEDGKRLYVGNMVANAIWVYDTSAGPGGKIVKAMHAGASVRPVVLDPQNKNIIYQLDKFHGFKVRDVNTGAIKESIDLPAFPASIKMPEAWPYTVDHGLEVSPDGTKLIAVSALGGYAAVYSLPDYKLLGTVKVGEDPNWVKFTADSRTAFVSNRGTGTLSVIDMTAMKEVDQIAVGKMPSRFTVIRVPARNVAPPAR